MQEMWKDIAGFEGVYKISNLGEIISINGKSKIPQNIIDKTILMIGENLSIKKISISLNISDETIRRIKNNVEHYANRNKLLNPSKDNDGYLIVGLTKNKKLKTYKVHRLVLETFVGPCPKGMICRHLDGNPSNNRLDNLEWSTNSINMKDRVKHGTQPRGEKNARSKFHNVDILNMRQLYKNGWTTKEIGEKYNTNYKVIWKIVTRKLWKHLP
jgi:transposase